MNQIAARTQPATAPDFVQMRNRMVDTQIRPVQVSDPRIIKAMRELPREQFVPAACVWQAYADRAVRLDGTQAGASPEPGMGRVLMEPRIIGRMLQVSVPRAGEAVLVVGAGTGYAAALLAALGLRVIALEQDLALAAEGARVCATLAPAVQFVTGPLAAGWAAGAPYDLILIDGAVRSLPEALTAQLAPAGRLTAVLQPERQVGTVILAEASNQGLRSRPQFDATTVLIPELVPAPRFAF